MTNEELRKSICQSLKLLDRRTLKVVQAIVSETLAPDDGEDEKELYDELERRSKAYKTGKSKLLTVAEVQAKYHKRRKKRES